MMAMDPTTEEQEILLEVVRDYRFLIVDDLPMGRVLMERLLETLGCIDFLSVPNGREALDELDLENGEDGTRPFDVVWMDTQMPVMDGIEAITMIRSSEKIISQPYIVRLSSGLDHREAGEDAFLCQPYTKKSIEQLLLVAVQYRELKKELLKLRAKQQK
eukprot:TRINITY_DN2790_c0_g1_i1.p1 TRINITY_DN2790_c0_g1~~TRINITY_DN2790_c0_g1_i1.p1  ORF type:complete len:160 (+),score=38.33 TRINITY_DN2790_c0_g1_i1:68-547(+)